MKSIPFEEQQLKTNPTKLDKDRGRTNIMDVRAYDSEVKGLEDILTKTSPESEGSLKIISERNMCESCSAAIEQFEKARPNIKIEKVYIIEYP